MKVPYLDIRVTDPVERESIIATVEKALELDSLEKAALVNEFEEIVASSTKSLFAVGVSSGTEALYLAIKALDIGPGDEVICPCWSWIATANAVIMAGAKPVFADVDDRLNLDPISVEKMITGSTAAIIPVHFAGSVCQIENIVDIARERGLFVIEDCAQAFSASYKGRPAGSFGDVGCFSMGATKVLSSISEAGAIVTSSDELAGRLKAMRNNGLDDRRICNLPGRNSRIDVLQAAILLDRHKALPKLLSRRRHIADMYDRLLKGLVLTPYRCDNNNDAYYSYTIQADYRNELRAYLADREIETQIHYPLLMSQHPAYLNYRSDSLSNANRLLDRVLCLPANEKITDRQVEFVAGRIRDFYNVH